jgi:t-SNARE complex subunit (syntaxin)
MAGVGEAASIIAIIDLSAKVSSLCYRYSVEVKGAKADIEHLQLEVNQTKDVLQEAQKLLKRPEKSSLLASQKLNHSLDDYFLQLVELQKKLEPGSTRKAMSRAGIRALKWPFKAKEVEKVISRLERYKQALCLALEIDQT